MRVLRSPDYRRMPWKNGGGETREVAVSPAGASLETLDWRLSLATVASDGPFSKFPGITRTLAVLRGTGIHLDVAGQSGKTLTPRSPPCSFDGELETGGRLIEGPIVDLNLMTRRGRFHHRMACERLLAPREMTTAADLTLLFCCTGLVTCRAGAESAELDAEDCAIFEEAGQHLLLESQPEAVVYVIELFRETAPLS